MQNCSAAYYLPTALERFAGALGWEVFQPIFAILPGIMRHCCLVIALCLLTAGRVPADDAPPTLRLPETAAPLQYRAELTLDPARESFKGHLRIQLQIKQSASVLWLNATKLRVQDAMLRVGSKTLRAAVVDGGSDFLGFQLDQPVSGKAELQLEYTGTVRTKDSSGLFHMLDSGNHYLYTQFEPTDARAVFPCFDEPSYKVPWQLTLTVPEGNSAVSNTAIAKQQQKNGMVTYHFTETKPLPSYLIAFGVGPFDYVDGGPAGSKHIPVRIVTPKGHAEEAVYAAKITSTIIGRLEEYFGSPFPYEKSDQVAVPMTYGFGAMENAGMVTYGQTIILAKPGIDTSERQRLYASVAAHELAHQWFGDLVTTAWWNDIWLNEAFATWMEQKILREWKPEWKTDVSDVSSKLYAEGEDSLVSARKIRQEIATKDDIGSAFDGITYQKGAAVIGMFENWVGADNFQKGVRSYLTQYSFRNASAPEFLDSIASASKRDVGAAFSTFLNQPGLPLVTMDLDCTAGAPVLHLAQERYLPSGAHAPAEPPLWQIPVCIRFGEGAKGVSACEVLQQPKQDWKLPAACPAWIEGNSGAVGYYRVNYSGKLSEALVAGDTVQRLSAPERADFMGNASALASAAKISEGQALGIAARFAADPERRVVQRALDEIVKAASDEVPAESQTNYQRFFQQCFQERARRIGWLPKSGDDEETRLIRPPLLKAVATWGGDQRLTSEAKELAEKWLADPTSVDASIVSSVLFTAAFYGDKLYVDQLLASLNKLTDRQQRNDLIASMTALRSSAALDTVFEALMAGRVSLLEGSYLLLSAGRSSSTARTAGLKFMKAHFAEIVRKAPSGGFDFTAQLPTVGRSYCDSGSRAELTEFFNPKLAEIPAAGRALAQTLEKIDDCIATKTEQEQSVREFLAKY